MPDREKPVPVISIPWRLFGGLLLASLVLGTFSFFTAFNRTLGGHFLDTLSVLYTLFLALVCFRGSWRLLKLPSPPEARKLVARRFIPALFGLGMLWVGLALLAWKYELFRMQQAPTYPSLFQMLSFGAYPFFIAAILLLPSKNLSGLSRLRMLLDSLIIMLTVATLYGYLILVPLLVTTRGTFQEKMVGSLLTAADLVLLFCLLFVTFQTVRIIIRQVTVLLMLAAIISLVGHVAFLALLLSTESTLMIGPNLGMFGSFALIAVAAQTMRRVLSQDTFADRGPAVLLEETGVFARGKTVIVSLLVLIFALLLLFLAIQPANVSTHTRLQVVEFGGTGILVVLVLRQLLSAHELNALKRELREKNAQLDRLAASDPLTGVLNHRTLVSRLDEALTHAKEQQTTCSVLFMDIDHFKSINDQHGHTVGDLVLCQFTQRATSLLRPEECLGRWGGEEFVAVLPGQDSTEAFAVAERFRTQVSEQSFAGQAELHVTCSLGVATYPQTATERERLLICADQAMYEAKRLGRNQTCLAVPEKDPNGALDAGER